MAERARQDQEQPEQPAQLRPEHVQSRALTKVAGDPKGWRKRSQIEMAHDRGLLKGADGKERHRVEAAEKYRDIWLTAEPEGRDSTQALNISLAVSNGIPISVQQGDAIRTLLSIESRILSPKDRAIVRNLCGFDMAASEAVARACGKDYEKATGARLREALDALALAFALRPRVNEFVMSFDREPS